ncbi:MAG: ferredoxin [Bacilli bacterium]|nr:ferredoxin [Bacilli bacterium]
MKKIIVDDDMCIGCGYCFSSCDLFDQNDDGKAEAKDNNLENMDEAMKEEILDVKDGCPVGAIKIEEN